MTNGERMAPVDRAWLLMERPTNPMVIVAVIALGGRLSRTALRRIIEERLLAFDRFRCRPVSETLGARWERTANFDLDDHVLTAALPSPAGQRELESLVGDLCGTPFNQVRPWWSFHLVERYGRGSAIVARIHHCYADGIALMKVLLGMTDGGTRRPRPTRDAQHGAPVARDGSLLAGIYEPVVELLGDALRAGAGLIGQGAHYALHPGEAADVAADATGALSELVRLALLADDPATAFKRPLSGARRVAWAPPLALEQIKALSHALDCTVNDVLMATLAGALGAQLRRHGERTAGRVLHAAVPVNLRRSEATEDALGNRFGLVFVELPVGMRSPLDRLFRVRDSMRTLKASSQAMMTYSLLAAVGSLPQAVEDTAIDAFTAKASLVASNVPGPPEIIRIGGVAVRQLHFWVPQAGSIGIGVSLLSYHGQVQFGVMADRQLIADPAALAAEFVSEFERLVLQVSLLPPPADAAAKQRAAPRGRRAAARRSAAR
ncbi:MAG TPA: wax ester/triacylglycerol synthase family O-acyltransferase [Steroidobacteraceae bacterium]|nr:wax ester/triacylglycerol synthase family O-acyltransferase [Steroidobacteraceae bacterium]